MPHLSLSPAKYAQQLTAHQEKTMPTANLHADALMHDPPIDEADWTCVPVADSPEDVSTRTIPLDGGTAIIETLPGRVELTVKLGSRIVCGLALSPAEAEQIGTALARPDGFTLDDYLAMRDQLSGGAR